MIHFTQEALLISLRNVIYFMPPFIIKKNQLDRVFNATIDIFNLWEK